MWGVFRCGWPARPMQSQRMSSVRTNTTLGFPAGSSRARAVAAPAKRAANAQRATAAVVVFMAAPSRCQGVVTSDVAQFHGLAQALQGVARRDELLADVAGVAKVRQLTQDRRVVQLLPVVQVAAAG